MQINHGLLFLNAWMCAEEHPRSFRHPDPSVLKVGDLVKVTSERERFWVRITAIDGDAVTGNIDNHLVIEPDLYGKQITFHKDYVFDVC